MAPKSPRPRGSSGDAANGKQFTDAMVFRYCVEDTSGRAALLSALAASAGERAIAEFAEQVSLFSGCRHHAEQILILKRLLKTGADAWRSIAGGERTVSWESAAPEIAKIFSTLSLSPHQGLSDEDVVVLKDISSSSGGELQEEEFHRLWRWLYPVTVTLSKPEVNALWNARWIEGFVSSDEAESAVRGQEAGTFVLRFPTSRSWPHPDAGGLVATYVGTDSLVYHRLISLHRSGKDLPKSLMEQPELSRLGRFARRR